MPSLAELCGVYKNRTAIDASLSKIHGLENGSGYADDKLVNNKYWSSQVSYDNFARLVGFSYGYVGSFSIIGFVVWQAFNTNSRAAVCVNYYRL